MNQEENINENIKHILRLLGCEDHIIDIFKKIDFENIEIDEISLLQILRYKHKLIDNIKGEIFLKQISLINP